MVPPASRARGKLYEVLCALLCCASMQRLDPAVRGCAGRTANWSLEGVVVVTLRQWLLRLP